MESAERGYVGLLAMVVVVGLIGLFFYIAYIRPTASGTATSTPEKVGQSSMEQDIEARDSAKALLDVSAKRAAEINAEMQ